MIITSWNVKGFVNPKRRREVLQFCHVKAVDVLGIIEAKIPVENIDACLRLFMNDWSCR